LKTGHDQLACFRNPPNTVRFRSTIPGSLETWPAPIFFADFQKLSANLKAFLAERLRTY
jgi:hypothetical protein